MVVGKLCHRQSIEDGSNYIAMVLPSKMKKRIKYMLSAINY